MDGKHWDEHWMGLALEEAARAAQAGEVPIGAVVVLDGRLLAGDRWQGGEGPPVQRR